MLSHVAERIEALASEEARTNFSKALQASIDLKQGSSRPRPHSPLDIRTKWGVSFSDQTEVGIALTIKTAHVFLNKNGKKISLQKLKKRVKDKHFRTIFGRKGCRLDDRGTYLATYAELLFLVDFVFDIPYPKSLRKFL